MSVCVSVCVNEDTQGERRGHFVWYRGDFKNSGGDLQA